MIPKSLHYPLVRTMQYLSKWIYWPLALIFALIGYFMGMGGNNGCFFETVTDLIWTMLLGARLDWESGIGKLLQVKNTTVLPALMLKKTFS
jgi:hypothetical protein